MACLVIEFVDHRAFLGACLMWRWTRATGVHYETWEGILRGKWVALSLEQKQYDFQEVDPYAPTR